MSTNEHHYKWQHALDWFDDKIDELLVEARTGDLQAINGLAEHAKAVASKLDSDDIQDIYQTEMDQDGYFDELHEHRSQEASGLRLFKGRAEDCPICEEEEAAHE